VAAAAARRAHASIGTSARAGFVAFGLARRGARAAHARRPRRAPRAYEHRHGHRGDMCVHICAARRLKLASHSTLHCVPLRCCSARACGPCARAGGASGAASTLHQLSVRSCDGGAQQHQLALMQWPTQQRRGKWQQTRCRSRVLPPQPGSVAQARSLPADTHAHSTQHATSGARRISARRRRCEQAHVLTQHTCVHDMRIACNALVRATPARRLLRSGCRRAGLPAALVRPPRRQRCAPRGHLLCARALVLSTSLQRPRVAR
jgi:hypothetical protein